MKRLSTNASITLPVLAVAEQTIEVRITATDALSATETDTVDFTVLANRTPSIEITEPILSSVVVRIGQTLTVLATANDEDSEFGQSVGITWSTTLGSVSPTTGDSTTYTPPASVSSRQTGSVVATATDDLGVTATDAITVVVPDPTAIPNAYSDPNPVTISAVAQLVFFEPATEGADPTGTDVRFRRAGSGDDWTEVLNVGKSPHLQVLTEPGVYEWGVRGFNDSGESEWSLNGKDSIVGRGNVTEFDEFVDFSVCTVSKSDCFAWWTY